MKRTIFSRIMAAILCTAMIGSQLPMSTLAATVETVEEESRENYEENRNTKVVSTTYKDPQRWTDNWRESMVSGNGENGVLESCHPTNDTFIFQNTKFNMPTNDVRETADLYKELDSAREAVMNGGEFWSSQQQSLAYDYGFHPGPQLRVKMNNIEEDEIKDYQRYTDYETAEIGVLFQDKEGGNWERKTFTSREDNVTISYYTQSSNQTKLNLTLSIDDLSEMAIDSHSGEVDPKLKYKKIVGEQAEYIGLVAHYPEYENSELKEAGYAGITYVMNIGGTKSSANDKITVEDAKAVVLITKLDRDVEMGRYQDFEGQESYPLTEKLIADTKAVADTYSQKAEFDYSAALEGHVRIHKEEYNKVTFELEQDEADEKLTNEELIQKQRNSENLNQAMVERAFYAGRYAQICSSGYSTSRLGGIWTGAWNPRWQGDFTTDANVNLQISGVNIGNMRMSSQGYISFILRIADDFEDNAKQVYGMSNAIMAPPRTDGDNGSVVHFNNDYPFNYWNAGSSWLLLPIYEYWQCFGNEDIPIGKDVDLDSLKSVLSVTEEELSEEEIQKIKEKGTLDLEKELLLPLLIKQANFWEQLVDPRYYADSDGYRHFDADKQSLESGERYLLLPGYSPENKPSNTNCAISANTTMDVAAARSSLDMLITLYQKAGDTKAVKKWEAFKELLPEYQYDEDGALKEWALMDYSEQNNHRHVSHMYGVWPEHEGEQDETLMNGAKTALENRKKWNTGDDNASHGWLHQALTEARMKQGTQVEHILYTLMSSSHLFYSSMMTNHDKERVSAYCTDASITMPAIMMEALAYSDTGVIEILPALPEGWNSGTISGMLSRSQAEIESLNWNIDEHTATAEIRSNADQVLTLKCGEKWSQAVVTSEQNADVQVGEEISVAVSEGEKIVVTFELLNPAEGTYQIQTDGKSLKAESAQEEAGVVLSESTEENDQKWNLVMSADGAFYIKNVSSGRRLSEGNDATLVMRKSGTIWAIEDVGDGYKILNQDKTKALTVKNEKLTIGKVSNASIFRMNPLEYEEGKELVDKIEIHVPDKIYSGESVQFTGSVYPESINNKKLKWSVKGNGGDAYITENGMLFARKAGTIKVKVSAVADETYIEEVECEILPGTLEGTKLYGEIFGRTDNEWEQSSPAANVFDGDTSTFYDGGTGAWAGIKLDEPVKLKGVRIIARADGYEDRMPGVQIQGSNDNKNWDTLYTVEKKDVLANPLYIGTYLVDSEEKDAQAYQYYRAYGDNQFVNIAELEFWGDTTEQPRMGLKMLIQELEGINSEYYTEESIAQLEEELNQAKKAAENEQMTEVELRQIITKMQDVVEGMKKVWILNTDLALIRNGSWREYGDNSLKSKQEIYTEEVGDSVEFEFDGTGFEMYSNKNQGLSFVDIYIDDELVEKDVSLYQEWEPGTKNQLITTIKGLKNEIHTAKIVLSDKANDKGKTKVSIDAFKITVAKKDDPEEVDKTALKAKIAEADKKVQSDYTEESWSPFAKALQEAKIIAAKEAATQEEVIQALTKLNTTMNGLVEKPEEVDKTELHAKIAEADKKVESDYTEESWSPFAKALKEAKIIADKEAATQEEVAEAITRLTTTMDGLVEKPEEVDKTELHAKIAEANKKVQSIYTTASWKVFAKALQEAKVIAAKDTATENEVKEATTKLDKAMKKLVKKPVYVKGWKKNSTGWWYQYADGTYPANKWVQIDKVWYHFNARGYMQTGWLKDAGTWYYLKSSGAMATGWAKIGKTWYYLNKSGKMLTNWQKIGGTWYYLKSSGAMATDWQKLGRNWYYLNANGSMRTGWLKLNKKWYYLKSSGEMVKGWNYIKGVTYFFNNSGEWTGATR